MEYAPKEVLTILQEKFGFPTNQLFGVVSSKRDSEINARMMRIYDMTKNGQLILLTHTDSQKWQEFSKDSHLAICFIGDNKLTQVIVRGTVKLETKGDDFEKASLYWERIRSDVKMLYDPKYKVDQTYQPTPSLIAPQEVPETSGIVTVSPNFWEILELAMPYTESQRFQFKLSNSGWIKVRMSLG